MRPFIVPPAAGSKAEERMPAMGTQACAVLRGCPAMVVSATLIYALALHAAEATIAHRRLAQSWAPSEN
jgi:hypothetical protein